MPSLLNDQDGKSEATLTSEALLELMLNQYDNIREVLRIPLGIQEIKMGVFPKWWKNANYDMRMAVIRAYGLPAVMRWLEPVWQGG